MGSIFSKLPKELQAAIAACKPHFLTTAAFSALINVLYLAPTLYMMQVYDRVVPTSGLLTLFWLTVILGIAIGSLTALDNIRARLMIRASLNLDRELSGPILNRLMARNRPETSGQALRDFDMIRGVLTGPAVMAAFDIPWTPVYLIAAFLIHPLLGLLICVSGVVLAIIAIANEHKSRERSALGHRANAQAYASQEQISSKAELVRALGLRSAMATKQRLTRSTGLVAAVEAQLSTTHYTALTKFVRMFMQSLALGAAAWLAIKGEISVGTIIAASVLLSRALQPIEQLVGAWPSIVQARSALTGLKELFEATQGDDDRRTLLPEPEGYVELSNITLRNPQQTAFLLRGISFWLIPGEIVGLVGHSGAGKSTLARIVAGAIKSDAGDIRIDDASYEDWGQDDLAQHIGYLPQNCDLLNGTIAENISRFAMLRGESVADVDRKVVEAAQAAGVHELILRLPDAYDARIGDPAFGMSGGQAQRIALARALYDNPKILVLDEPSASLDAEGEQALMRAIVAAKQRGAAILLIAHRSSVLDLTDRLVILAGGAIERQGPRSEVVEEMRQSAAKQKNVVNFKSR